MERGDFMPRRHIRSGVYLEEGGRALNVEGINDMLEKVHIQINRKTFFNFGDEKEKTDSEGSSFDTDSDMED
jgi:hypothetical protein